VPQEPIARSRFLWKKIHWLKVENLAAIWIHSTDGTLSYTYELNEPIKLNPESPFTKIVPIKDLEVIREIESKICDLDVSGAYGKGLIVGELPLRIGDKQKSVFLLSSLKEWRDWLENKRFFKPGKK
jgi:hypothetical protein